MSGNYSSAGINITWNGLKLSNGYLGISVTPNGDTQQLDFDLKGRAVISRLANQGASLELEYRQGSQSLKDLDSVMAGLQLVGEAFELGFQGVLTIDDPTGAVGSFVAVNAVLANMGDETIGETVGSRTATFYCEKLIRTDNVADVLAKLASYLED